MKSNLPCDPSNYKLEPVTLDRTESSTSLRRPRDCEPSKERQQASTASECAAGQKPAEPCDYQPGCNAASLSRSHYNRLVGEIIQEELGCGQRDFGNAVNTDFEELWHILVPSQWND